MKELKFTNTTRKRLIKAAKQNAIFDNVRFMTVTQHRCHGSLHDIVLCHGIGFFMISDIGTYSPKNRGLLYKFYWQSEGFESMDEFKREIERLYADDETLYVHLLEEVHL